MGKFATFLSIKCLIPVPSGVRDLFGEIRVACTKYVEHTEKYRSTQQEYTGPQNTLKKGKAGLEDPLSRGLPGSYRMNDAPVENPG